MDGSVSPHPCAQLLLRARLERTPAPGSCVLPRETGPSTKIQSSLLPEYGQKDENC